MKPDLPQLSDFPEWLSPMLVKELRQGMRTHIFTLSFVVLQVVMLLSLVFSLLMASANQLPGEVSQTLFWAAVSLPVALLLPLSGHQAIHLEVQARTLELMQLTHLSASRIVWGKWFAIVVQMTLFLFAVLPYVVLRYFVGGINLWDDLRSLAFTFFGGAVFTALVVGLSGVRNKAFRVLFWVGFVLSIQIVPSVFMIGTMGLHGAPVATPNVLLLTCVGLVFGLLLITVFLEIAAGRIAPPSENHSTIKRLVAVFFLLGACGVTLFWPKQFWIVILLALGCVPILLGAIAEEENLLPSLYRPFLKWGFPGRLAARFLCPGWPAGVVFSVAILSTFSGLMVVESDAELDLNTVSIGIALLGCLVTPVAILRLFGWSGDKAVVIFFVFQIVGLVLAATQHSLREVAHSDLAQVFSFHPLTALISLAGNDAEIRLFEVAAVSLTTFIALFILLNMLFPAWKRLKNVEKQITQTQKPHAVA